MVNKSKKEKENRPRPKRLSITQRWSKFTKVQKGLIIALIIVIVVISALFISDYVGLITLSPVETARQNQSNYYNYTVVDKANLTDLSDDESLDVRWYQLDHASEYSFEQFRSLTLSDLTLLNIETLYMVPQVDCEYILAISCDGYVDYFARSNSQLLINEYNNMTVPMLFKGNWTIKLTHLAEYMNLDTENEFGVSDAAGTFVDDWTIKVLCLNESMSANAILDTSSGVASCYDFERDARFGLAIVFQFDSSISLSDVLLSNAATHLKYIDGNSIVFLCREGFLEYSMPYHFTIAQDDNDATGLFYDFNLVSISAGYTYFEESPTLLVTKT